MADLPNSPCEASPDPVGPARGDDDRLRVFVEHAPALIAMFDRQMRYLAASRRWADTYLGGRRDFLGTCHYDVFPDCPERWREAHRRGLAGEVVSENEDFWDRPDGSRQWVWYELRPWYAGDGSIGGIILSVEDITKRKRAEEALRNSEARFRAAVGAVSSLLWTNNAQGRMEGGQPGWSDFTGQSFDEYQGYGWAKAVHPDDAQPTIEAWNRAVAERRPFVFEHRVRRHDGQWRLFAVRAVPVPGADGKIREWVGVHTDITERRAAEEALRNSEAKYRTLFEAIDEGFCIIEVIFDGRDRPVDYCFLETNPAFVRQTGLADACGRTMRQMVPGHEEHWFETYGRIARTGVPERFENRAAWLNRWYDVYAWRFGRPEDRQVAIVFNDVTQRKRTEEALRQSEEKFRAVFEQAAVGMGRVRFDDARWMDVNVAFCRMVGYTREELLATPWPRITHPDDVDLDLIPFSRMAAGELDRYSIEKRFLHKDGRSVWARLTLSLVRGAAGRPDYEIAVIEDITGRKRAEETLRAAERHARSIIDNMIAFSGVLAPDGTILEVSRKVLEASGQTREDVVGRKFWDDYWWAYDQKVQDQMRWAVSEAAAGRVVRFDTVGRTAGDGRLAVDIMLAPARDESGRITHLIPSGTDITERKRAVEALRQADRRKDRFLATLAHELRNPLAPVRAALQILEAAADDPAAAEAAGEARAVMGRQIGHMVRLIDDLMDVARITTGRIVLQRRPTDLADVLRTAVETARPLLDRMGHRLTVRLPETPMEVDGDPTRLAQVFANLLNNAAKYTDPGGDIRLSARREGGEAVVRVADNGIGIPADRQARVFEMFHQAEGAADRSDKGLGIGLTVVKGLVELHGGRVEVRSEGPGAGSEFIVGLPAGEPAAGPIRSLSEPKSPPTPRLRVLVVDDNPDITAMQGTMLRIMGYETRSAGDGLEAVAAAEAFRPDVVLMDLGMPRLDGCGAAREIRNRPWGSRMLLVAVSGWGQEEDRRRATEAGFDRHLVKPVDFAELKTLLAAAADLPVSAASEGAET